MSFVLPQPYVDPKGRKWKPFAIDFESPDGRFTFHIYAISRYHAELQVEAIRESARVAGQIVGGAPAGKR